MLEAQRSAVRETLLKLFSSLSVTFFAKYSSVRDFESNPDVTEEYFFLLSRAMQYFPEYIVCPNSENQGLSRTILQASFAGMQVNNRAVVKGILSMYENMLLQVFYCKKGQYESSAPHFGTQLASLIVEIAMPLISGVVQIISDPNNGSVSEGNLDTITEIIWSLKELYPVENEGWVARAFSAVQIQPSIASPSTAASHALCSAKTRGECGDILDAYVSRILRKHVEKT